MSSRCLQRAILSVYACAAAAVTRPAGLATALRGACTRERPWHRRAREELDYARAIASLAALTQDSHVRVSGSRALGRYCGEIAASVLVRYIEGRPIVTRVLDEQAAPGLVAGDEIVSVDGEDVASRAKRIEECIAFSRPASRNGMVGGRLLSGAPGSAAWRTVRAADGGTRDVEIDRPDEPMIAAERSGEVFRIGDGNIGYADLERRENARVAAMFEQFRQWLETMQAIAAA